MSRAQGCAQDMCWRCALHPGLELDSRMLATLGGLRDFRFGEAHGSPRLLPDRACLSEDSQGHEGPWGGSCQLLKFREKVWK